MPAAPELPADVEAAIRGMPWFSREIARLMAEGLEPHRIATRMNCEVRTVLMAMRNVIRAFDNAGAIGERQHSDYHAALPPRPPKRDRPKRERPKPAPRIRAVTTPTRSQRIRAERQALAESRRFARVELGRRLVELTGSGMTVARAADAVGVSFWAGRHLRKAALRRLAAGVAAGG